MIPGIVTLDVVACQALTPQREIGCGKLVPRGLAATQVPQHAGSTGSRTCVNRWRGARLPNRQGERRRFRMEGTRRRWLQRNRHTMGTESAAFLRWLVANRLLLTRQAILPCQRFHGPVTRLVATASSRRLPDSSGDGHRPRSPLSQCPVMGCRNTDASC